MTIAFVHPSKAFLPGLAGYTRFFSKLGIHCEAVTTDELGLVHRNIEWFFLGTDLTKPREGIFKIHEYTSTSTPPFRGLKDFYKSYFNTQPDFRIFQNEFVKNTLRMHDHVPFTYRDVGIPTSWLTLSTDPAKKEFDFVYLGELYKRQPEKLFDQFTQPGLRQHTLLVLSKDYGYWQEKYKAYENIVFMGPVGADEVNGYLQKARFGINYIPGSLPFTELTSTKFLEYAATSLPVISTDYAWIRRFQQTYGGRYFYIQPDWSNFSWEAVTQFDYAQPDLSQWTWDHQIIRSGIPAFLQQQFPEVDFGEAGMSNEE